MDLLFNIKNQPANGNLEQLHNTDFSEFYDGISGNLLWRTFKGNIEIATDLYILPWIGSALYNDLANKVNDANATLTDKQAEIVRLLKFALAHYTAVTAATSRASMLSDNGPGNPTGKDGSWNPSNLSFLKINLWSNLEKADKYMDKALSFLLLETENTGYFDLWKNDTLIFSKKRTVFFKKTSELDDLLNIQDSFRTFIAFYPYLKDTEDSIEEILCLALFEEIKTQIGNNTLTEYNKKLLPLIRKAIATNALYQATFSLSMNMSNEGFRVISQVDGFDIKNNVTGPTQLNMIEKIQEKANSDSIIAFKKLKALLEANADDYPLWKDSPCRAQASSKGLKIYTNECNTGAVLISRKR